jgi:glucokinase
MSDADERLVGIDLGGTKITAGLVDSSGTILFSVTEPTPASRGAAAVLTVTSRLALAVVERAASRGRAPSRIGVGASGVIDAKRGVVVSATDSIPDWTGADIRGALETATGLDTVVINDVHAHALGEAWIGAGRGFRTVLLVTVGTGVGGACLSDGTVHLGENGLAGHLGHVPSPEATGLICTCGKLGHLEAIAAGPAIHQTYLRLGGDPLITHTRGVMELVREDRGDPRAEPARRAIVAGAVALGRALGGMINTFDPGVVIVGGGVAAAGGLWWDEVLKATAGETLLPIERYLVVPPLLGQGSAIIGAAHFASPVTSETSERRSAG